MKRRIGTIISLLSVFCLSAGAQNVRIHTYDELNRNSHAIDSHSGVEASSSIEPVYSTFNLIPKDILIPSSFPPEQQRPSYPRIACLPNGQFLMTYQGGSAASRLLCVNSSNFKNWSGRTVVIDARGVKVDGAGDVRRSCNMDITVLKSGMILGVYVFRAQNAMRKTGNGCGLCTIRSLDNGKSWTKSEIVYEGICYEPQIVELPDGRVQIYFTDLNIKTGSTMISVIESSDYGLTFTSKRRIARNFKYYSEGMKVFTDRYPAFCILNNGKMFAAVEDRLENEPGAPSERRLSFLYNNDFLWPEAGNSDLWPNSRKTGIVSGTAPRVIALTSGEVLVAMVRDGRMLTKLADAGAVNPNGKGWEKDWFQPLDDIGEYCDIKPLPDGHRLAIAMDTKADGIKTCFACLNHKISAPMQAVAIDGRADEWLSDEALFIGSDSPAQAIFRASHADGTLNLLTECVDAGLNPVISISICNSGAKLKKGASCKITFNSEGLTASDIPSEVVVKKGRTINGASGFVCEISLAMDKLGIKDGDVIHFNAEMTAVKENVAVTDSFFGTTKDPRSWQLIELSSTRLEMPFRASHSGEEQFSALQPMPSYSSELPASFLLNGSPEESLDKTFSCYPRIKMMADGRYIMFYMSGRFGSRIWCTTSSDLKEWSEPQRLFSPEILNMDDGTTDVRRYMDPDATVLKNGDVLMVTSFRATSHYRYLIGSGLALRRSTDNGKTWSEPWEICHESNWEPTIIALPDGRIQCYFTHSNPQTLNSGTSVMTSFDNGNTWTKPMRCSRQYKYDYRGTDIYTDQMPSMCVLPDGKTIAGWVEARLESKVPLDYADKKYYGSYYKMSLVLNDGFDWKDLGEHSEGPARRRTNVERGAGGYIDAFPSGEVVVGCGREGYYCIKLLTTEADVPYGSNWSSGWTKALPDHGYWGTVTVDSPQTLVAAIHNSSSGGMQIARFHLNHRIDAKVGEISDDALYLGDISGAEVYIRASRDENDLILKIDGLEPVNALDISLCALGSDKIIKKNIQSANGEIRVSLESLGSPEPGDYVCIFAEMTSGTRKTVFNQSDVNRTSTWQRIRIN